LCRRALAQRRQLAHRFAAGPDRAAGGTAGLGLWLGVEPQPRAAFAVHDRGRADALRWRADGGRGLAAGRALHGGADAARHALGGLPDGMWVGPGERMLRLYAAEHNRADA